MSPKRQNLSKTLRLAKSSQSCTIYSHTYTYTYVERRYRKLPCLIQWNYKVCSLNKIKGFNKYGVRNILATGIYIYICIYRMVVYVRSIYIFSNTCDSQRMNKKERRPISQSSINFHSCKCQSTLWRKITRSQQQQGIFFNTSDNKKNTTIKKMVSNDQSAKHEDQNLKAKDDNVQDGLKFSIDSSAVISGLASGLISYCKNENEAYVACKSKNENPERCLKQAIDCRKCAFKLYVHIYLLFYTSVVLYTCVSLCV